MLETGIQDNYHLCVYCLISIGLTDVKFDLVCKCLAPMK